MSYDSSSENDYLPRKYPGSNNLSRTKHFSINSQDIRDAGPSNGNNLNKSKPKSKGSNFNSSNGKAKLISNSYVLREDKGKINYSINDSTSARYNLRSSSQGSIKKDRETVDNKNNRSPQKKISNRQNSSLHCTICNKQFSSEKGLNLHTYRSDHYDNQDRRNSQSLNPSEVSNKCYLCTQQFKNQHGVTIHIRKAHPEEYRKSIVEKACKSTSKAKKENIKRQNVCQLTNQNTDDNTNDKRNPRFVDSIDKQIKVWKTKFESTEYTNEGSFSSDISEFSNFIAKFPEMLPGPKHPARRYYEARKRKGFQLRNEKFSNSNPQRKSFRKRVNRKAIYEYQITQYYFFNQRRKAVRRIYEKNKENSSVVDVNAAYEHFSEVFEVPNNNIKEEYGPKLTDDEVVQINCNYSTTVSKDEILSAIKGISVDTAPGPDKIIMRAIKAHPEIPTIISLIATIMIKKKLSRIHLKLLGRS